MTSPLSTTTRRPVTVGSVGFLLTVKMADQSLHGLFGSYAAAHAALIVFLSERRAEMADDSDAPLDTSTEEGVVALLSDHDGADFDAWSIESLLVEG